jgi:glutamate racemase
MSNDEPVIGIFDSGIGGLSVLGEIRHQLPKSELIYLADSANAPYGDRSATYMGERSLQLTEFLVRLGIDALVIACNTASAHAVQRLRSQYTLPIIAMEPAIKPAALASQSKVVAVLATSQTIASSNVARLIEAHGREVKILLQACPGLVEHVEAGDIASATLRTKLAGYIMPLIEQGADLIVLGCTHYPFLVPLIREIIGPNVQLLDPAPAVARELVRRLGMLMPSSLNLGARRLQAHRADSFYSSAPSPALEARLAQLLGHKVALQRLPL